MGASSTCRISVSESWRLSLFSPFLKHNEGAQAALSCLLVSVIGPGAMLCHLSSTSQCVFQNRPGEGKGEEGREKCRSVSMLLHCP